MYSDLEKLKNTTMWDPNFEKAACGMGFVAQIDGRESHKLVDYALTMLERMNHRGGTGAEPDTGDGAGILLSMPDEFFRAEAKKYGITLPKRGDYAVGMFFLSRDHERKDELEQAISKDIEQLGYRLLWVRDVPFNFDDCGPGAQEVMPSFLQIFVEKPMEVESNREFEDRLYLLRRHLEKIYAADEFFICSLSSNTIVYKGMLHAYQVRLFYPDLSDKRTKAKICLAHSRFSTNTFPSWDRAQPFRFLAHNGEINTLKGAQNWMYSHGVKIYNEENSDSAKLENCMEYLYREGREIPQVLMMMIPESFSEEAGLTDEFSAFYEYATSFMAPWDGPAGLVFTDGHQVGAALDRNGLRPSRFSLTKDGFLVVSSESGVVDFKPSQVVDKGVLGPGEFLLVDTIKGTFQKNSEIKQKYAHKHPYRRWLNQGMKTLSSLKSTKKFEEISSSELSILWKLHGYTDEVIRSMLLPMAEKGEEPVLSMGFDSPLAVLSHQPQSLFTYFKQQFAQVTNPPIDAIREKLVIGTQMYLGGSHQSDFCVDSPENCVKLKLEDPILSMEDYQKILALSEEKYQTQIVSTLYDVEKDMPNRLQKAIHRMCMAAEEFVDNGATILVLSDYEKYSKGKMSIPILLAVSALQNYMVDKGKKEQFSIVVNSVESFEVHHFAALIGFGASAIHPYGAYLTLREYGFEKNLENYRKACVKGIVKVMSRMGISTMTGYKGAQLFEAIGLSKDVIDKYFIGTTTRIGGINLQQIEAEYLERYHFAYGKKRGDFLPSGGNFQYKTDGEHHLYNPQTVYQFQQAVRSGSYSKFKEYTARMNEESLDYPTTLRSMWMFNSKRDSVKLSEVEPVKNIVKRFKIGAMSFGSLSKEAHECIAEAMNKLGGKSNSGEGGESRARFKTQDDGRNLNSKIKQIASGRFGVNAQYLISAEELQIKMAQGAKPGEGGQLPGEKVFPWVAEIRGSTPGVRLISPPPHHDIYSIEDLAQLIYDLKAINPYAKINVKLVSSTGVGTIATGCVKAGADIVVISGYDGGTGASPRNSLRDAGLPWEMGLAETHQTLTINRLRNRMILETDGKLMTGRDIVMAALLGAEEYSFATLALVAIGCVMMRVCNLNTCPVGVATQNPELRSLFQGKPEHIKNMMVFLAEEVREIMADLGFRAIDEMVGHTEVLTPRFIARGKAKSLDFSRILTQSIGIERKVKDPFLEKRQWKELDLFAEMALSSKKSVTIKRNINNVDRAVGARMGGWISERFGNKSVNEGQIAYEYKGIAGQSFGAFATQGIELKLIGEANDYVGKGLSGARIIVVPPEDAAYPIGDAPIVGNVACFGANFGEAYFYGRSGERFCVRNSGANVIVEGVGDHGCEYMTGGVAVILGSTGRNFAAGMSGGIAYVYDENGNFSNKCNQEMVDLYKIGETSGDEKLRELIEKHFNYTNSKKARKILENWECEVQKFVKVYPTDYHAIVDLQEKYKQKGLEGDALIEKVFAKSNDI
ncbi:MAG: glutamate synthase large subunit [Lactobacillales bacterium]|jgi:glutamate synthase (NADPH/NADH) large chain|nr:glutamate synthase large subunit [Lactobacillales bacterium]